MKLLRFSCLVTFLFIHSCLFCAEENSNSADVMKKNYLTTPPRDKDADDARHIVCVTIPKTGTHLLYKCFLLLNLDVKHPQKKGVSEKFVERVRSRNKNPPPHHWKGLFHIPTVGAIPKATVKQMKESQASRSFWIHWPHTPKSEAAFNKYGKANFFTIRDPRDQLISMVFMVHKSKDGREVPIEDALIDLIDGKQRLYIPWAVEFQTAHPLMWEKGVVGFYKLYMPWMKAPKFHTVKFENLVGPQGGGTKNSQLREIQMVARHLGIEISRVQAENISQQLFGGTTTFREGQIGTWKRYFTPKVKKIFKNTPGACQLLIDLGYEKNSNW